MDLREVLRWTNGHRSESARRVFELLPAQDELGEPVLNIDQARRIADVILEAVQARVSERLVLVEPPRTFQGGWIFVYDSERFLRTGEISAAMGGNAPIAVFHSGDVELLDTTRSLDQHLHRLEA